MLILPALLLLSASFAREACWKSPAGSRLLEVASRISDFLDFVLFFLIWPAFLGPARDCGDRFHCVTDDVMSSECCQRTSVG